LKVWILSLIVASNLFVATVRGADFEDFRELRSEHFLIRYQQEVSKDYVYKIKKVAERYYRIITQEFNLIRDELWLWENRAQVFIAKDKEEYLNRFRCSDWSAACVNYIAKIIYTFPDQENFNSIFIHELTHIILHEYLGRNSMAVWVDEGIASWVADKYSRNLYRQKIPYLKKMIKQGKHIPLSEITAMQLGVLAKKPPDYVGLFYLESYSIVDFFVKRHGKYNFSRFLSYLRRGDRLNQAITKSFGGYKNFEELEKQWLKFYQK